MNKKSKRSLLIMWFGWAIVMIGFQVIVPARMSLKRPDYALFWTKAATHNNSLNSMPFLQEPVMNAHAAWDSEFYLAIAVDGYEAEDIRRINAQMPVASGLSSLLRFGVPPETLQSNGVSLSYAFFPFYPIMIRLAAIPVGWFGLAPLAAASVAGVLVSLLGSLLGMYALAELAVTELGEEGALRSAFYMLIFPGGFFLAQIYTEGLFVGLAFFTLLLIRKEEYYWAALFAILATFTRAVGVAVVIPLLISWLRTGEWRELDIEWSQIYYRGIPWKIFGKLLVMTAPLWAFLLWRVSFYGMAFGVIEDEFFHRGLLVLGNTWLEWSGAFKALFGDNSQAAAYYFVEWLAIILGFTACIKGFRRHPDLAIFSLIVITLSFTSGPAQGMHRYILGAPSVFLLLGRWGKNPAFDRIWTIASTLLMGMMATMFMFDMWAG